MKKILATFFACILIIVIFALLTNNGVMYNISMVLGKIIPIETEKYDSSFQINKLNFKHNDYYYEKLTDEQKKMYASIAYAVRDLKTKAVVNGYTEDNMNTISKDAGLAISAFFADHPEVFYLNSTYKVYTSKGLFSSGTLFELSYSVNNRTDLNKKIDRIEKEIDTITNQINQATAFDKELYIHDYIAKNVKYYNDIEDINSIDMKYHSIEGTFLEKQAVCDGFTKAFQILLDRVNIQSIIATGYIDNVPHAWNIINIDNSWYHVDLTSDKYIKKNNGMTSIVAHAYFNVTDENIKKTHSVDNIELLPVCMSTKENYFLKKNYHITTMQDFNKRIKEIALLQENKDSLEFSTDYTINVPNKLLNALYEINFNNFKSQGSTVQMNYYNQNNTYVVEKK